MRVRAYFWKFVVGSVSAAILVAWLDPYPKEPSSAALREATTAMREHRPNIARPKYLILIDYDRPMIYNRLWLIEAASKKVVLRSRVSQAFLSGPIMAEWFSNAPNSHKSCIGAFVTRNSYNGEFGYAMRVAGLQPGINDNALPRAIVFHSHWFIFWSGGCFVSPGAINKRVIDLARDGTFLYVHRSGRRMR